MKINLLKSSFLLICLFLVNVAFAQQVTITGTVVDEQDQPIIGANVIIQGTTQGATTGVMGDYRLQAPATAVLQVSFIGYTTQDIPVANRTQINVKLLPDALAMEEVVVVGYGTQKKVNLTGAVAAVTVDEKLTDRSVTNLSSGMAGLIPGLSVTTNSAMAGNDNATLMIRGLGSVNNANPLVVVDGMPIDDMNRINMNDVESISVLKDAAAASIYGSRAANGVILITTRNGRNAQGKTSISFNGSWTLSTPANHYEFLPNYPLAMSLAQQTQYTSMARGSSTVDYRDSTIDQWWALKMVDPLRYPSSDWWDIMTRTGTMQNYNVSASGGNDVTSFYISAGVLDNKGIMIRNDYKRYNARFNFQSKLRNNMNVGASFDGAWTKQQRLNDEGFTNANATADWEYTVAGQTAYDETRDLYGGTMAYNEDTQAFHPYANAMERNRNVDRQTVNMLGWWDWNPVKGLVARVDYSLSYYNQMDKQVHNPTQSYNFQTESYGTRWLVDSNSGVTNNTNTGYTTQFTARLNYNALWGAEQQHDFGAMFGYSEEFWYDRNLNAGRQNRIHPTLSELDACLSDDGRSNSGNSEREGLRSYIGRVNYALYGKYLFEVNMRVDGSSKFVEGRRFGYFPSAAFGWRFSEENFVRSWAGDWLTNGKLRVSYGTLGNNTLGRGRRDKMYDQQQLLEQQNYIINSGTIVKGFVYKRMDNEKLSWEKSQNLNVGLDLGFFRNRLNVTIDWYNRLTTGMIRPTDFSLMLTGAYTAPSINIGNLRNNGIETTISWNDRAGDWTYGATFNFSYNKNKLEKWDKPINPGNTDGGDQRTGQIFLNMPYRFIYTYQDLGYIAQTWEDVYSNPAGAVGAPGDIPRVDVSGDGNLDGRDRVAYASRMSHNPTTNFSLQGQVAWKNLDFSFLFQGSAGRYQYATNAYNDSNVGKRRIITQEMVDNPWTWDNRDGKFPRRGNGSNSRGDTTFWLESTAYVRLKNIQLGYRLPNQWLSKVGVQRVRIYFTAENLLTFTGYSLMDPEQANFKNVIYPMAKTYALGISVTF